MKNKSLAIVVMGVSGCGKTTIGQALARRLGGSFYDGDDFHPLENVRKMAAGIPLDDADRAPWLARLNLLLHEHVERAEGVVVACSALKWRYREQLRTGNEGLRFVYLQGSFEVIWQRMASRPQHYMLPSMLQSQFDTLEPPGPDEALTLSVTEEVTTLLNLIEQNLLS
ncbi:MAG: gluconokinase [Chloroflexi bacterium]|nr:gluconokinase [Chloroflexota bacterium]